MVVGAKGVAGHGASEGLAVLQLPVGDDVGALAEALAAVGADVGALASVDTLVFGER